jgi:CDP-diacylglycerol pyrophosphatase
MVVRHSTGRFAAGLFFVLVAMGGCTTENNRLQRLVTNCLDVSGESYCSSCQWPRTDSSCVADNACPRTTEVWRESLHYVAIRDKKMCSCTAPGFIHGLAMPRALISGVDAANRPNGIWTFAWQTARDLNIPHSDIALAINPKHDRSENQMHIHITRLRSDARSTMAQQRSAQVSTLDSVWLTAGALAAANGLTDYGVLVAAGSMGGFTVVVDGESPEDRFMSARCPEK